MDRTIPKEVQQRKRRRRLLMWGGGIAGVFALVVAGAVLLRPSVSRGGITLSTVDVGTLEISINASGTVEVLCSGAVAVGDKLSPAANGAVAKSTALPVCGIALTAGEDGSLVEMMPLLNLQATE